MVCLQIANAQEPQPNAKSALGELSRFAGTWEKKITVYKTVWSPEEQSKTGTHSCK